jgi:photosystem II stability/assembly factor-like uncharacterized protein
MGICFRHKVAMLAGLLLLCSSGFGDWSQLNSSTVADLWSVHFPEGTQVGYAVGVLPESLDGFGVVVKTTDGGATWEPQNVGFQGVLNSVYFRDDSSGFAVGGLGKAIRTSDGGANWETMAVPDSGALNSIQFPENGQTGYIGLYPQDGGSKVLKTTDGGDNWILITVPGPWAPSRSCGMATDNIGVVIGDSGLVMATTDGFGTFMLQGPETVADLRAAAFSRYDANRGYLIGNDSTQGVIRYTASFGDPLWETVEVGVVTAFYGVDMPTNDVAYICGADGFIGKTRTPRYVQRTHVPSGFTATMGGVCFPNGADTGYAVGAGGVILRTYDGGGIKGIADAGSPAAGRSGMRVVSNPSRRGITFLSDTKADVVVYDAAGRVVTSRTATEGLDHVPLPRGGVYVVRFTADGFSTTQKLVVEH